MLIKKTNNTIGWLKNTIDILTVAALLTGLIFGVYKSVKNTGIYFSFLIVLVCLMVICLKMTIYRKSSFISRHTRIIFFLFLILQGIYAVAVFFPCLFPDYACVIRAAAEKNIYKDTWTFEYAKYFQIYYNNIFLLMFYNVLFYFIEIKSTAIAFMIGEIFSILCIDISIVFVRKISKLLFSNEQSLFISSFAMAMLGFTPWIICGYSDTIVIPFILAIYYIYVTQEKRNMVKNFIIVGLIAAIAYKIKPTAIIIVIAICFCFLFCDTYRKCIDLKKICKYAAVFAMSFVSILALTSAIYSRFYKEKIEVTDYPRMGIVNYIALGQTEGENAEGKEYGGFNQAIVSSSILCSSTAEQNKQNIEYVVSVLKERGFARECVFLFNKLVGIMSDGSFFWGKEGDDFFNLGDDDTSGAILFKQLYVYSDYYKNITYNIMQSLWIILLGMNVLKISKDIKYKELDVKTLTIFGIILFLMIFEARSRYLLPFLPIFLINSSKEEAHHN